MPKQSKAQLIKALQATVVPPFRSDFDPMWYGKVCRESVQAPTQQECWYKIQEILLRTGLEKLGVPSSEIQYRLESMKTLGRDWRSYL